MSRLYQTIDGDVVLSSKTMAGITYGVVVKGESIGLNTAWNSDELTPYNKPVVLTPDPTIPVFTLAASNPLAQYVVENYAEEIDENFGDAELAEAVRNFARRIENWQKENPDKLNNTPK